MDAIDADAKLIIRDAAKLSEDHKLQMAEWLRQHAEDLLAEGHNYAAGFTGNFNPDPGSEVADEEDDGGGEAA